MDAFKIEIWKKDGLDLKYAPLNADQIQECMTEIAEKCAVPIDYINNPSLFVNMFTILKKQFTVLDINEKEGLKKIFSLIKTNQKLLKTDVDIIWNYNHIDRIELSTLQNYWDYIWYGVSDEMCLLYFPELKFLTLLTDYGTIYVL